MNVIYDLEHITTYRYCKPVTFGKHYAIFLPSAGYGGHILSYSLETNIPSKIRWMMDTLSNNVAIIELSEPAKELIITYRVRGEHFGIPAIANFPLNVRAEEVPVQYTPDEWIDLAAFMRPHSEDPDGSLAALGKKLCGGRSRQHPRRIATNDGCHQQYSHLPVTGGRRNPKSG